jgi:hypothetical protein
MGRNTLLPHNGFASSRWCSSVLERTSSMKIYLDFGYNARGVVDITGAELEVLTRVLGRVQPTSSWYGSEDIQLDAPDSQMSQRMIIVPSGAKILPYVVKEEEVAA